MRRAVILGAVLASAVGSASAQGQRSPQLANPASVRCVEQGGTLKIEARPDGGQYGVCTFVDNYQCEEWALLRGECPAGGIRVTGYATPAARYCALRGGRYQVLSEGAGAVEQGSCGFANGKSCAAPAFFDGLCTPASAGETLRVPFRCDGGRTLDALFSNGSRSSVSLWLSDGRVLSLPQALSGSGARYANADESIVFWNKGRTAFIDEKGRTSYGNCQARP